MIGQTVGNYVIEAELGVGGMGAVYRARHAALGRPAAVKILLPQFSATPDIVKRFFNEAKAATSIRHLGIVEVYDYGTMPDGVAYIAMELLNGESLAARMKRGVDVRSALSLVRLMCSALGAAHDHGIVHRDLKPDNVFVVQDHDVAGGERIKLLDFGIAKLMQDPSSPAGPMSKTRTGTLMGTPSYMAPEQCRGVALDHRADIYALGCILYELLSGAPPFVGEGVGDILAAHIYKPHEPLTAPTIPADAVRLVDRMLAKKPEDRPQSTRDVVTLLDVLLASADPMAARPTTIVHGATAAVPTTLSSMAGDRTAEPARSKKPLAIAGASVVGVGAIVAVLATRGGAEDKPPAPDAAVAVHAPDAPPDAAIDAAIDAAVVVALPDAPVEIAVEIGSTPPGAHVFLDGVDVGKTPYTGRHAKVDGKLVYVVKHDGYVDGRVEAPGTADIKKAVRLVAVARTVVKPPAGSGSAPPPPPPAGSGSDESVNPFRRGKP